MDTTLTSVEEALAFLEQASGWASDSPPNFSLDGELGKLQIEIEGPLFHGELTGEVARGLASFQDEIYRATLFALTGLEGRAAKLTLQQKEAVELVIDVDEGCTLINIDLGKFGEGLAGVLTTMTPAEVTVLVVAVTAVLAVGWMGKTWLVEHYKAKTTIDADSQETERTKLVAESHVKLVEKLGQIIEGNEKVARFAQASENGVREIATRARDATSVTVGRVALDQEAIAAMKKRAPRSAAEPIVSVGKFLILQASGKSTPFKLTLVGPGIPGEFDVEFDDNEFRQTQVEAVWSAFKTRTAVELQINAVLIGDKVKGAVLSDITPSRT